MLEKELEGRKNPKSNGAPDGSQRRGESCIEMGSEISVKRQQTFKQNSR